MACVQNGLLSRLSQLDPNPESGDAMSLAIGYRLSRKLMSACSETGCKHQVSKPAELFASANVRPSALSLKHSKTCTTQAEHRCLASEPAVARVVEADVHTSRASMPGGI